ncbi:cold-shock protein [Rhizobium terrae]|uniref:cold-shock protein n=1 Tax=Rhizobium terrae TaxID=2171756 RepID=UPI000E3E6EE6|nr:cold-shock protein [Rhizobium terrae]
MNANVYAIGDTVVLKASLTRTVAGDRACRIVGLLPAADRGENQYRVRFGDENFERRIVESDIDTAETAASVRKGETASPTAGGSWLKMSNIRIGK